MNTKPKRQTPTQRLEAELAEARAQLAKSQGQVAELEQVLKRRDEADQFVAEQKRALEAKVAALLGALKPLFEGSKTWVRWPGDDIALHQKLTWGALRRAKDAYLAHR